METGTATPKRTTAFIPIPIIVVIVFILGIIGWGISIITKEDIADTARITVSHGEFDFYRGGWTNNLHLWVTKRDRILVLKRVGFEVTDRDFDGLADKVSFETREGSKSITRVLTRENDLKRFSERFLQADSLLQSAKRSIELEIRPLYKEAGLEPPPQKP